MIKVVRVISKRPAFARINLVPANCPALVKLDMEIKTAIQTGKPPETAINPKVKDTGKYPRAIGSPRFMPYVKLFFISIPALRNIFKVTFLF
jgi:hypothetical protein